MSMEEKVATVESWFMAHREPYTLKELLVLIPRATGVIFQSVPECVELLLSEGRLEQEKVGVHTLIWRFPLTNTQQQERETAGRKQQCRGSGRTSSASSRWRDSLHSVSVEDLQGRLADLQHQLAEVQSQVKLATALIGEAEAVEEHARRVTAVQQKIAELKLRWQALSAFDPQLVNTLQAATGTALEAANRWTENFFLLEEGLVVNGCLCTSPRGLRESLHVPLQLDFIEPHEVYGSGTFSPESTATPLTFEVSTYHPPLEDPPTEGKLPCDGGSADAIESSAALEQRPSVLPSETSNTVSTARLDVGLSSSHKEAAVVVQPLKIERACSDAEPTAEGGKPPRGRRGLKAPPGKRSAPVNGSNRRNRRK